MAAHQQTWVKVNARVDRGIAGLIAALSSIPGLETLQSCEDDPQSGEAYVYFWYGSWIETCSLLFGKIIPALESKGIKTTGSVEVFNGSPPTAKIRFSAKAIPEATSALQSIALSA